MNTRIRRKLYLFTDLIFSETNNKTMQEVLSVCQKKI